MSCGSRQINNDNYSIEVLKYFPQSSQIVLFNEVLYLPQGILILVSACLNNNNNKNKMNVYNLILGLIIILLNLLYLFVKLKLFYNKKN